MASRAQEFFEKIKASGDEMAQSTFLHKLVTERMTEDEFTEFKGGKYNDKDTKKYWSQALSAFANTEGGVLIFGIKTDRVDTGGSRPIDSAVGVELVEKPEILLQLLKDTRLNSTVDPVPGVQYLQIIEPSGQGFVVCLVPEGPNKPYRAESDSSRNYFQRVGDSFVIINHSWLRTLFYPQYHPRFKIAINITRQDAMMFGFHFKIENDGEASAENLAIRVFSNRLLEARHSPQFKMSGLHNPQPTTVVVTFRPNDPLHPGDLFNRFSLIITPQTLHFLEGLEFHFGAYATNQRASFYVAKFQHTDFNDGVTVEAQPVDVEDMATFFR